MPGIAEFFAPGNIQQIYKEELKRFVEEQSTRITERLAKKIREVASLADSFENKVLKPWLPTNSTTYDYAELH